MLPTSIDHVVLAVPNLAGAAAPFERLGLTLTPPARHATGNDNRAFFTRSGAAEFYVEALGVHDRDRAAAGAGWPAQEAAMASGGALCRVMFAVEDADAAAAALAGQGVAFTREEPRRDDGSPIGTVLRPDATDQLGCEVALVHYAQPMPERVAGHADRGLFDHQLALQRLDHLAVVAPALDATCEAWAQLLGVPVFGEVRGRGLLIRQLKVGDAIVELLGPDSPESPLNQRPPGLISMAAFEVPDLDAAVAHARRAGFTASDPAPGVLPGTRTATVPPAELAGLSLQLLEYI
jgi:methylmalonyl-CoA/ethylmalonyl-CoA epimerase